MEWYCGKCPKNKEKCDFCKAILSDKAKQYADGEITEAYKPALTLKGHSYNRKLEEFLQNNEIEAKEFSHQYPNEEQRKAEMYEAHYQVGKESLVDGNFELSMNFFQNILEYKDSNEYYKKAKFALEKQNRKITEQKYEKAVELYERAEIAKARELFYELGDYLDSKQKYERLDNIYNNKIRTAVIVFGILFLLIVALIFF